MATVPHRRTESGVTEAERLDLLDRLRDLDRRALSQRFASAISHALGTPLNVIAGRGGMIAMGDLDRAGILENARIIEEQVRSVTRMIQTILRFARVDPVGAVETDLAALPGMVCSLLDPLAERLGVRISSSESEPIVAVARELWALHVLTNLVDLGIRAVGHGGGVHIQVERGEAKPPDREIGRARGGEYARYFVKYEGFALDQARIEHAFEPWLHAPSGEPREALLLAAVLGVAGDQGGWVEVAREHGGTLFTVNWPLAEDGLTGPS